MSDIILGFLFAIACEITGAFTGIMIYKYYSELNKKH
jgi:hypothetical protein